MIPIASVNYVYRPMPIGGGGYATGFCFHPAAADVLYCRTDIGGMYRFDVPSQRWISLMDSVTPLDAREAYPISMAVDPARPERLYVASGVWKPGSHGLLTVSDDRGASFRRYELPAYVHGNLPGRGAGERLLLARDGRLWFASQRDGLLVSRDEGASWQHVPSLPETDLTFVAEYGDVLLVGTEGVAMRQGDCRGPALYASFDGGCTFAPVPQPDPGEIPGSRMQGPVAMRSCCDGTYVYVTFTCNGPRSQQVEHGYSCDSGDSRGGRVVRYRLASSALGPMEDITPEKGEWGYCAVCAERGLLVTATICRRDKDAVYLSRDGGATWRTVLHGLHTGRMDFRLSYMKPEYNGGGNLIHWLTDVRLDPHDGRTAWFTTGTGVFRTGDITADTVVWQDWCDGMEETVHLAISSPPSGDVRLLDMVGDLGGFAFREVDRHCGNTFADADGHRWITCQSCDYRDDAPEHIIAVARGNWTGKTRGGLIESRDGARTWQNMPMPLGLDEELDALLGRIMGVNTNGGWAALASDGRTVVWGVCERSRIDAKHVVYTRDGGATWRRSRVLNLQGEEAEGLMKPFSDRVMPDVFYGLGEAGQVYVSTDGGATFRQKEAPSGFPEVNFGCVDGMDRMEVRVASGEPGVMYLSAMEGGVWKLCYDREQDAFTGRSLTPEGTVAWCLGLGLGRPGGDYFRERKMLYTAALMGGEYGFWRSADEGESWVRINRADQMYGNPTSMDGDARIFGRVYLATGTTGLHYGDMAESWRNEACVLNSREAAL